MRASVGSVPVPGSKPPLRVTAAFAVAALCVALGASMAALPVAAAPVRVAEEAHGAQASGPQEAGPPDQEAVPIEPPAAAVPRVAMPRESNAELDALARQVASRLRCPVCEGLSVQDSPTELAREMKDVIREQLAAGTTPEEVKAFFVARYGEWVLLEPEPRGFNLLVYILPVLALLTGAGVVGAAVRRWTRPSG